MAGWRDERGLVLPLALMVLAVLAGHAAVLLTLGRSEVEIAANHLRATQAYFLAEAGLEDAINVLRAAPAGLRSAPETPTTIPGLSGPGPTLASFGTYVVLYQGLGPSTARIAATATASPGIAERTIRATVSAHFTVPGAVLTGGDLALAGGAKLHGGCGSAHANGGLVIDGEGVEIAAGASAVTTATGSYTQPSGTARLAPTSGAVRAPTPTLSAAGILAIAQADPAAAPLYLLARDGRALRWNSTATTFEPLEDQATPAVARTILRGSGPGWEWRAGTPPEWGMVGAPPPVGTFYLEGDVVIAESPGALTPWSVTLIAADAEPAGSTAHGGSIRIDGAPRLEARASGIVLAADRDVVIGGVPGSVYSGLILARGRIDLTGGATINGALVAQNADAAGGTTSPDRISGDLTITYDCGLSPPLQGPLRVLAWGP